jgi:hypothetical protein
MDLVVKICVWLVGIACFVLVIIGLDTLRHAHDPTMMLSDISTPALSREEQILKDCGDIAGAAGLWVEDRDGDGLVPALVILNFQPNYQCVMNGVPRGYIHITNANQIGLDADDMDNSVHFAN